MIKNIIAAGIAKLGYRISKIPDPNLLSFPIDFEDDARQIISKVTPYTMTSLERLYGLIKAVDYIEDNQIKGDVVECGVWRGGSTMAAAFRLLAKGTSDRDLWLYDTFEGMPAPTENDFSKRSGMAQKTFDETKLSETSSDWCHSPIEMVQDHLSQTNYPAERLHYVKGMVEDTIPAQLPGQIALLRLDTDWYESTKHELEHLYSLLVPGGVLIIDDYGHWEGCRKAVDEFFAATDAKPLLSRLDYTGRIAIKPTS